VNRPFQVVFDSRHTPGEIRVDLSFAGEAPQERADQALLVLADLEGLAGSGALAGDRSPSGPPVVYVAASATTHRVHRAFTDGLVAPAALSCIVNVTEWIHHHVFPLAAVRLSWSKLTVQREPVPPAFPARWPRLGYPLHIGDFERRFDIDITLQHPQPQPVLDGINEQLGLWYTGVSRGAYASESIAPADSVIYFTDEAVETAGDRIIWSIDALRADEAALDGLANALERIHATRTPLARVTVD
jgi:hypothetical protein